ncbi:hypothetical protein C8R43DRAFT_953926 [Mycena crocata]|nr:hypothetical protein C8R43DRAFT_953926 [Mycena crocata]
METLRGLLAVILRRDILIVCGRDSLSSNVEWMDYQDRTVSHRNRVEINKRELWDDSWKTDKVRMISLKIGLEAGGYDAEQFNGWDATPIEAHLSLRLSIKGVGSENLCGRLEREGGRDAALKSIRRWMHGSRPRAHTGVYWGREERQKQSEKQSARLPAPMAWNDRSLRGTQEKGDGEFEGRGKISGDPGSEERCTGGMAVAANFGQIKTEIRVEREKMGLRGREVAGPLEMSIERNLQKATKIERGAWSEGVGRLWPPEGFRIGLN